jgi:TPR repeat protein
MQIDGRSTFPLALSTFAGTTLCFGNLSMASEFMLKTMRIVQELGMPVAFILAFVLISLPIPTSAKEGGNGDGVVATFAGPDRLYQHELLKHMQKARLQLARQHTRKKQEPIRQELANMAINLARQVEAHEALGQNPPAKKLMEVFSQELFDSMWRLAYMSQHGHAGASLTLGLLNRHGILTAHNEEKACRYYALAAEQGEVLALYRHSTCLPQVAGQTVLQRSAEQGHPAAQEVLGRECYERLDKNMACALNWLGRASIAGRASAQALLGWIYYQGKDVSQDYRKAYDLYAVAANAGDRFAQNNLAECYELGRGTGVNASRAFVWYRKAAESGLPVAEFNLGRAYLIGLGTQVNKEMAKRWLVVSAQHGIPEAKQLLNWDENISTQ